MADDTSSREDRRAQLQAELDELDRAGAEEVDTALGEAEEAVAEVAEESIEGTQSAHETIEEAEHDIQQEVEEVSHEVAKETGLDADTIAEHLLRKMEERGYLPSHGHSEVTHEAEVIAEPVEQAAEVPAEVVADTPPEPQHFWYRERRIGKRR